MSHHRLRDPRHHAALAEVRSERVPQGVNVEHPPAVVALRYPGGAEVSVQRPHEAGRHVEQRSVVRQPGRQRQPLRPCRGPFRVEPVGLSGPQVGRQVELP